MIVYRVQAADADRWVTEWKARQAEAITLGRELGELYAEVHVDKVDVEAGRDGLVVALTHADVNRINWPGEEVWRS